MKVAKSYSNYSYDETKAYKNDKGNLVVNAVAKCERCGGTGIFACRVENGVIVPHPAYGGVCLACDGNGKLYKTIRLYTDEEFEKMEKQNQKNKEKKEAETQERMKAEYAEKKTTWLKKYNCNEKSVFIYFPSDSYEKKEELKTAGFTFIPELMWHAAAVPEGYSDLVVEVPLSEIVEFSAWGAGFFKPEAKDFVKKALVNARPTPASHYIAEEGKRVYDIPVTLTSVRGFEGMYGYSQIVRFEDKEGNIIKWFTSVEIPYEVGDHLLLTGTVKSCSEDKYEDDAKVTTLTRCKMKNKEV